MALPDNILSTAPVVGNYLSPDNRNRELLVDYEQGGIALYDTTEGLDYQAWKIHYDEPDVILTPETTGSPVTAFSFAGISELSLAFDQNMNPFVAYVRNGEAWYWWYDTVAGTQVHTKMDDGVSNPRCTLDDKRATQTSASDIILAYIRNGNLYFRQQRDRYGVEYELATGITGSLIRIGMGDNLRLHFGLTGSAVATVPTAPSGPVEVTSPYYGQTDGTYIDLSALQQTTFSELFGMTADLVDFENTYAVNKAAYVPAITDAGNRIQLRDSIKYTAGAMYITDTSGNILSQMHYNNYQPGESLEIPTGVDCWVVVFTDTGKAQVKKWDESPTSTTPNITGATPFSEFASGYDFGERSSISTSNYRIPAGGISFYFTVPSTSDSVRVSFSTTELNGTPYGNIQSSISQTVGDLSATPNNNGRSDTLTGGINLSGTDIDLIPGNTYFWNLKYASGAGIVFLNHSYTVL